NNFPKCRYTESLEEINASAPMADLQVECKDYKCPRCKTGYFVKQEAHGRVSWVCSNRSHCRTQCADMDGVPSLYKK
ncbi:MAG: hypothetical protein MSN80_05785, partial [Veillonella caviae]